MLSLSQTCHPFYREHGDIATSHLKAEVTEKLDRAEHKLLTTWYPEVLDLVMRDRASQSQRPEQQRHFYQCVSVLLSNQARDHITSHTVHVQSH